MIQVNYHIHSNYCDGVDPLDKMVQAAINEGLISIGLTSHMTLPFDNHWSIESEKINNYFATIDKLKEKYRDQIEIYKSMEIDYFMDQGKVTEASVEVMKKLDYVLMSIHSLGSIEGETLYHIDESPENFQAGIDKYYDGNIQCFVFQYYKSIGDMVEKYHPDIVGHLDLIKKNNYQNRFFDEKENWYREAVFTCLDRISQTDSMIEINTGANMRYPGVGRYPSDWMIPEMKKRNIPITIGGDSHSVAGIINEYQEAENFLIESGYREYGIIREGRWETCQFGA